MTNVVSFSGGKDSTAMLLMMLERGIEVDEVVFFDTGWEFPQMYEHVKQVENYTGIRITRLKPPVSFDELLIENHRSRGKRQNIKGGYGWPTPLARWCTTKKVQAIERHLKDVENLQRFIGIAADERHRCKSFNYPLVEWGITENQALHYCYERGFSWGGLYDHFHRVSCWCCPLQRLSELRQLRNHFPELWDRLLLMDMAVNRNVDVQVKFRPDYSLPQIEQRFRAEDAQTRLVFE